MVLIRMATLADLNSVLEIYNDAVEKFANEGTYQWVKGYPNAETFKNDLKVNNVFVVESVNTNQIIGVMTILHDIELDYNEIDGQWLNNDKYYTIHRIAVKKEYLGMKIGSKMIDFAIEHAEKNGIKNIRIDTHELNTDMKRLLEHKGFRKCGIIKLRNKNFQLRDAYHYCGE